MTKTDNRAAWADFWSREAGESSAGCLPHGLQGIDAAQGGVWTNLARELTKGARVLDLGTGDGAVLKKILAVRKDLRLTGVDSSPTLPPAPKGIALRGGVAAEALPFADRSFDAVTSQFGFEYTDTATTSREVARVLKPQGSLRFITHLRSGPILAHNLPRRETLRWALEPGGYADKARALVMARRSVSLPTPPSFRQAPAEARRLFPSQTVGAEFVTALLQTLDLGRNAPVRECIAALDELVAMAGNEIARIDSLERAACDEARALEVVAQLGAAGVAVAPPKVLGEGPSNRPFSWLLTGSKPG